jgi:ElaB/YqjD/DUF883 family membrane-anchored ribosome-binding protein
MEMPKRPEEQTSRKPDMPNKSRMNGDGAESVDLKSKIQVVEKQFDKMSHEAGAKVASLATDFVDSTDQYMELSKKYVKNNPLKSVLWAAAAGLVLGSYLTLTIQRRMR